jgi:hypothetical protein
MDGQQVIDRFGQRPGAFRARGEDLGADIFDPQRAGMTLARLPRRPQHETPAVDQDHRVRAEFARGDRGLFGPLVDQFQNAETVEQAQH